MTSKVANFKREVAWTISGNAGIIGILAFLTLIGLVAGVGRLLLGLRASTALTDAYPWGIWIGFDFTLIAFAGVGFTIAAIVHILHLEQYQPVTRPAILAGLLGYGAVLALLVLDLGRPDRFYHFILFWNIHSPLFEISWCVLLYTTVLVVEVSPCLLERFNKSGLERFVKGLMAPVTIIGVTLSTLHQSTLGTLYLNMPHRLHPLWYTPILPLLFFVSAVMAGLALAALLYHLTMRIKGLPVDPRITQGLTKGLVWVLGLYLLLKIGEWLVAGELTTLLALDGMSLLALSELGLGVIIPLLLWFVPSLRSHWAGWGMSLLVLFGVLLNRFNATMFAQQLPPGTTYSPHILEWLSTLGILAGVALVWFLAVQFLEVCEA